jgi:hypothetical protein
MDQSRAVELANKEVKKLGLDLKKLNREIDRKNARWNKFMTYSKTSPDQPTRELYKEYEAKLRDKDYWVIYYRRRPVDGGGVVKGGGATVIIEKVTCSTLLVIRGE